MCVSFVWNLNAKKLLTVLKYGDGLYKYYCILVTKSNKILI